MSDNLSGFRLVAIATDGAQYFGTGETSVRTVQDLAVFAGLPELVRTGDTYDARFTLRNGTDRPMEVVATPTLSPAVATGQSLTVTIPAGGAVPISWSMTAPPNRDRLNGRSRRCRRTAGNATGWFSRSRSNPPCRSRHGPPACCASGRTRHCRSPFRRGLCPAAPSTSRWRARSRRRLPGCATIWRSTLRLFRAIDFARGRARRPRPLASARGRDADLSR